MRRWLPFLGSFLIPLGVVAVRFSLDAKSQILYVLGFTLIIGGSAAWFLYLFGLEDMDRGHEFFRAALILLLLSYLLILLLG